MVNNFWVNKRRDKQFTQYGEKIAKKNKITLLEFGRLPKTKKVEMLEEFLKAEEKKAKKAAKENKIGS
jgi:hypothetical protein